jgi:hypothetical protein
MWRLAPFSVASTTLAAPRSKRSGAFGLDQCVRERFPPHALEIPQVRQVVFPLPVTRLIGDKPRGVGVRVEQLVGEPNKGGDLFLCGIR